MATIAFVGLGSMGLGMAGRLLAAGHSLRVYNRTSARADALLRAGARLCATPAEAGSGADALFSMVSDDAASRSLWRGPHGLLAAQTAPGAFAVECSTLSHDWVCELATQARDRSLRYIDAPVTGLPESASSGALTLLIGAEKDDLDAARGLLDAIAERIIHFGAVGTGCAYKLIINLLGAVQIASAAEALAIAERAGLDLAVVAQAISTSQAASPQVIRNSARMVQGRHHENVMFTPQLRLKDVNYALRMTQRLAIGSPFGKLAGKAFRDLCKLNHVNENESAIIEVARSRPPD